MMNLSDIRHYLHQHPELSGQEYTTHDFLAGLVEECQPSSLYTHVGGEGLVAVWGTEKSRPTLAFRADIDALPINELTDLPYRSTQPFVAHKCGHDGHSTILIALARKIAANPQLYARQNVMLIFQPEEEVGTGSQKILDAGILQQYNIKAVYGLHNIPGYPEGTVILNYHTFAAASTGIIYHFEGRQTHASTPEQGINPGLAVAEMIKRFAAFNAKGRSNDDFRQSTLICVRLGDEAFGTSAGQADVMFTLRAFSNEAMGHLLHEADQAANEIAARHHLQLSVAQRDPFYATENNSALVENLERMLCDAPYRTVFALEPFRWSEDFANYQLSYPGVMFGLGAGKDHAELHHPDYDFPDGLIDKGADLFERIINDN